VKVWRAHERDADGASLEPGVVADDGAVATAAGVLALDEVQPEGKRPMPAHAWRAGFRGVARLDSP
jgi:methionyl-tRNA formyltransferase